MRRVLVALALGIGGAAPAAEPLTVRPREVPAARDVVLPPGAIRTFGDTRFRHPGGILASALSPDGKRLATAANHSVVLWDTATGTALHRFDTGRGLPWLSPGLAFSADGTTLAAVVSQTEAFVWDVATTKEVWRVTEEQAAKARFNGLVAFTPDGRHLVLGRTTETEFRATRTWRVTRSVSVVARQISPVGPTLVGLAGANGDVSLADLSRDGAGEALKVQARAGGLALSPDGRVLATFSVFGKLELWSVPGGRQLRSADVRGNVSSGLVVFGPGGKTLFLNTGDNLTCWDVGSMTVIATIPHTPDSSLGSVTGIHALPDGETLLVCGSDGLVRRFPWRAGQPPPGSGGYTNFLKAAATADGRRLAVGDQSGRVDVWDTATGERGVIVWEAGEPVSRLAFSPDGRVLAIGRTGAGTVEVRDPDTGREVVRVRAPGSEREPRGVRVLAFSPDGRAVAAASIWGRLQTWDARTGDPRWSADPTGVAAFSPDGKSIAYPRPAATLVFLDAATGERPRRAQFPDEPRDRLNNEVTGLAFSADGRRLGVATGDGRVRLCDPETGAERWAFQAVDPPPTAAVDRHARFTYGAEALAFSVDGRWLLAGGPDGSVRLWEVDTRQEARRFTGHERRVTFVAFGPGETTALSAGDDGGVYQWDLRPAAGPAGRPAWDDLASPDAAVAYRAVWALRDDPAGAVRVLRARLPRAVEPTPEELARLIARLDSDEFTTREAASKALVDLGPLAAPALRAALKGKPPAEARERITKLLDRLAAEPSAVDRRAIRAVLVVERIGTADARTLLTEWAAGAPAARLAEESKAALARIAGK